MADRLNSRRLARLALARYLLLPTFGIVCGLLLEVSFGWRPVGALEEFYSTWIALFTSATSWRPGSVLSEATNLIAAPMIGFLLGMSAAAFRPVREALRRFPGLEDPPDFIRVDLDAEEGVAFTNTGWTKPAFVDREEELHHLTAWAIASRQPFTWKTLVGQSGVGKSRLALRWLAVMDRRGWDAGVVDPFHAVKTGWRARRCTALVIDDAQLIWDGRLRRLLEALRSGATEGRPLRVLVINSMEPQLEPGSSNAAHLVDASREACLRLGPIDESAAASLWRDTTKARPHLAQAAGPEVLASGLPLAIIRAAHGALEDRSPSYWSELASSAVRLCPELADNGGTITAKADRRRIELILFASMAGPLRHADAKRAFGDFGRFDLCQILPASDLDRGLPRLTPDDLRIELLLRCMAVLGRNALPVIEAGIHANPGAVESILGSAWTTRPEGAIAFDIWPDIASANVGAASEERAHQLVLVQQTFDQLCPARVEKLRQRAIDLSKLIHSEMELAQLDQIEPTLGDVGAVRPFDPVVRWTEVSAAASAVTVCARAADCDRMEKWGSRLHELSRKRPMNREICLVAAQAASQAIAAAGSADRWDLVESWGRRLHEITGPWALDPSIRISEAAGIASAVAAYGEVGDWAGLERWGARLAQLAGKDPFRDNAEIQLVLISAAVNAIGDYGRRGEWVALERWADQVKALVEVEMFRSDLRFRRQEAMAAHNAICGYGQAGLSADLARWGERLRDLVRIQPFDQDPAIRLEEACAAVVALKHFGHTRQWSKQAAWQRQLDGLVRASQFHRDRAIRLQEARASIDAIIYFAQAGRWADVSAWTGRLEAIVDAEPFASDIEFRRVEAECAVNAISRYGISDQWSSLERWGDRLERLAGVGLFRDDEFIQLEHAKAASNAMIDYGRTRQWDALNRWGNRLDATVRKFPDDPTGAFRRQEALGAFCAIQSYSRSGTAGHADLRRWQEKLARSARWFPEHAEIEEWARACGLSPGDQERRGWPFGRDTRRRAS